MAWRPNWTIKGRKGSQSSETPSSSVDSSKEIVVTDLHNSRFKVDHISVKSLDEKVTELSIEDDMSTTTHSTSPNQVALDFNLEKDVPDLMSGKVYNSTMSRDKTLPKGFTPEEIQAWRRKWLCLGALFLSFLVFFILLIVILTRM